MTRTDDGYADLTPSKSIETDLELQLCLPEHYRCFSYTLQLFVRDGLKDAVHRGKVLNKVFQPVSYVHHSTVAAAILEAVLHIKLTHCSSQVRMIRPLSHIDNDMIDRFDCQQKLNVYKTNILRELCEIWFLSETATDMTQGESHVAASLVVPCVRVLWNEVAELSQTFASKMAKTLTESIAKRLGSYETKDIFTSATTLDPRFQRMWCTVDIEWLIFHRCSSIKSRCPHRTWWGERSARLLQPRSAPSHFASWTIRQTIMPARKTRTSENKMKAYFVEGVFDNSTNPLQYWKNARNKYRELPQVGCSVFQILVSSAHVELIETIFVFVGLYFFWSNLMVCICIRFCQKQNILLVFDEMYWIPALVSKRDPRCIPNIDDMYLPALYLWSIKLNIHRYEQS